ncbi:Sec-independent protein translocase subunit TatA [Streptomyces olivoreticuli]|uniref:Sec-independent protein translocase subunit TatA n=1 Tax=Streptomyces olivoreticuli TaxID=68246 RepID=UPI00265B694E|nr:Sec-independent protein translocase subunit TatA [Streptomyces olivoreticuli]WKK25943.1 Sec-independent protein translocase subunit TatA [Streptomyces olivoreticuli]
MFRNGLEPWHIIVVVVVAVLLFGSKKLPDTARALGKSMRILKSEAKAMKEESGTEAGPVVTPAPAATVTTANNVTPTTPVNPVDSPR